MKKTIGVVVVFAWVFATQITAQTVWYKWIQNSKYNDDIQTVDN